MLMGSIYVKVSHASDVVVKSHVAQDAEPLTALFFLPFCLLTMLGFLVKLKLYIVLAFYHQNMSGSGASLVHPVFEEGSWEIRIVTPPPHLSV